MPMAGSRYSTSAVGWATTLFTFFNVKTFFDGNVITRGSAHGARGFAFAGVSARPSGASQA